MDVRSPQQGEAVPSAHGKLSSFKLFIFSLAALPVAALGLPLVIYLPNYYASHLHMPLAVVGLAFLVVKLIDIGFDPILGIMMDRTRTRFGRFKPWMMGAVPLLVFASLAVFLAQPGVSPFYLIFWLLMLYFGFSMGVLGHSAWAAALVPEYHQRSRIYAWLAGMGVVAAVISLALPPLVAGVFHGTRAAGVQAMGWFVIITAPLGIGITMWLIPDRNPSARQTGFDGASVDWRDFRDLILRPSVIRILIADWMLALGPAITAALYIFFFTEGRGYSITQTNLLLLIYILAGLAGAPFWARMAKWRGKHRTLMAAAILYCAAQSLVIFLPRGALGLMTFGMFSAGFIISAFVLLIRAMMADVADEVRLETGKDRTGFLYALITSTQKVGSAMAIGVSYPVLAAFGFNAAEGAVNSAHAIWGLEVSYLGIPTVVMAIGGLAVWGYKLDAKRHGEIREALDGRDASWEGEALEGAEGVIESLTGNAMAASPPLGANPP